MTRKRTQACSGVRDGRDMRALREQMTTKSVWTHRRTQLYEIFHLLSRRPPPESGERPRTLKPLAERLGCSRTKLYSLIDQGLPDRAVSPGGRTKWFFWPEVLAWLDGRKAAKDPGRRPALQASGPRRGRPRRDTPKAEGSSRWLGDYRNRGG